MTKAAPLINAKPDFFDFFKVDKEAVEYLRSPERPEKEWEHLREIADRIENNARQAKMMELDLEEAQDERADLRGDKKILIEAMVMVKKIVEMRPNPVSVAVKAVVNDAIDKVSNGEPWKEAFND